MTAPWTVERVRALGVVTDLLTAGEVLGLSRNSTYRLNAEGQFPVPVLTLGSTYRVPVAGLIELLGITPNSSEAEVTTTPAIALTDPPTPPKTHGGLRAG